MKYTIPYEVDAETPFAAIVKATEMLRTGVYVEHVKRVEASVQGWYYVDLEVSEPESVLRDAVTCSEEGHVPGCAGTAGGAHEWEDHEESHPEMVEGCGPCENRAERSAAYWERAMRTY